MYNKVKKTALENDYQYNHLDNIRRNSKSSNDKFINSNNLEGNGGLALKTISIDEVIYSLQSIQNRKQFFALLGNMDEVSNEIFTIQSGSGHLNIINIEAKKVYLYNSPFSFFIKQIINNLPVVNIEDKKVLWERVLVLLSALNYGNGESEFCQDFEENLDFDDPLEAIRLEFNEVFEAYGYRKPLVIIIRDFRGLEFADVNSMVTFITTIFNRVANFKVLVEINPSLVTSHYQNYISDYFQNWYTLFDGLIDCRNLLEPAEFDENETIFFDQFDQFNENMKKSQSMEQKRPEPVLAVCPPKPNWKEDQIAKEIADQLVQDTIEMPETVWKPEPKKQTQQIRQPETKKQTQPTWQPEALVKTELTRQPEPFRQPELMRQPEVKKIDKLFNVKIPDFSVGNSTIEIPSEGIQRFEEIKAAEERKEKRRNREIRRSEEKEKTISQLDLGPLFGNYTIEEDFDDEPVKKETKVVRSSFLRQSDGVEETIFDPEILMDSQLASNARSGFINPFKNKK